MQPLQAFFFFCEVASIVASMLINIIFLYNNFVEEDCDKTCYVTILVIFFLSQNSPKYCTQSSFYERNVIIMKCGV